ncbi:DUF2779 domain-containing protein, partial [Candidatus Saccharibacteria bacterium]|nr:DUF2779 domain-containing protein [Candidatus Saccharibacteria bacterium]
MATIYRSLVTVPPYSIYDLASPGTSRLAQLEHKSITLLADIPDGIEVTDKQALQIKATKTNAPLIEYKKIARFLDGLNYPLYFLDYETIGSLVPPFEGMRPYQQLPFQYSLHILESPNGELIHREYLHTKKTNPAPELAASLRDDIGPVGTVLAWYADFEMGCNNMLADILPEHAAWLTKLNQRVQDLMLPFSSGWYVDKDFYGSASIKKVLPVLVPELSYKDLDIQEGQGAQRLWMSAVLDG